MRTARSELTPSSAPSLFDRSFGRTYAVAWVYVVLAIVLGFLVPRIDAGWVNHALGRDQLVAFLSATASGMMAFTGITFSLLFLLLQFGSSAYSPHLFPLLARNRVLAHAGGVFTGTFLYSLMALRGVGADDGATTDLTVLTAFAWLIGSVYLLLRLVGVFASLGITDVLDMLGELAERESERVYGARQRTPSPAMAETKGPVSQTIIHRGRLRYLIGLDVPKLVGLAKEAGAIIRIPASVGDSVPTGSILATVETFDGAGVIPESTLREAVLLGRDRSVERGPKQALRLLVDIAIRALSPAMNDPTTAVHALDQIEVILLRLGDSDLDIGHVTDSSNVLRLQFDAPTWEEYLYLGLTEIQQYGAESVQVERRLAAFLALLQDTVRPARKPVIQRLANERLATVHRVFPAGVRRRQCELPDRQGIGHTRQLSLSELGGVES